MSSLHMERCQCPVCGMDAKTSPVCAEHIGIEYHFCSSQCRENFLARPTLYVGPASARQQGREVIKRRSISLEKPVAGLAREHLQVVLKRLMGIRHADIEGDRVKVEYNLVEITADQIGQALAQAGAPPASGWIARLKHYWTHYTEQNELDNLAADAAACCSRPPAKG